MRCFWYFLFKTGRFVAMERLRTVAVKGFNRLAFCILFARIREAVDIIWR